MEMSLCPLCGGGALSVSTDYGRHEVMQCDRCGRLAYSVYWRNQVRELNSVQRGQLARRLAACTDSDWLYISSIANEVSAKVVPKGVYPISKFLPPVREKLASLRQQFG